MSDAAVTTLPRHCSGRHVRGGADGPVDLGQPRERPGPAQDRDAEVQHLHQAAVGDHHVAGLDVAVHDVDPVHVGEHRGDLRRDRRRPRHRDGGERLRKSAWFSSASRVEPRSSCMTSHSCVVPSGRGLHAGVVDGGSARVLELGGDPDLAQEPLAVPVQRVEDLDRLRAVRRCGRPGPEAAAP